MKGKVHLLLMEDYSREGEIVGKVGDFGFGIVSPTPES